MRNRLFFVFFGLALITRVIEDVVGGLGGVYEGVLFPWRHPALAPVASSTVGMTVWILQFAVGLSFIFGQKHRRTLAFYACLTTAFSLTQMYQNQKLLLLAVSFILTLGETEAVRKALKWQIIVVYLFSFLHKIESEFWNGDVIRSFANLLLDHTTFAPRIWVLNAVANAPKVAAVATLTVEVLLPIALITKPRIGFALVVALHAGFALVMPDITTFGLTMAALASLYLDDQRSNSSLRA